MFNYVNGSGWCSVKLLAMVIVIIGVDMVRFSF